MNGPCMGDSHLLVGILQDYFTGKQDKLVGIEVGVHRGETSALLLRSFPQLFLYMVDPWATYPPGHPYRASGDSCSRFTAVQQQQNMRAAFDATQEFEDRRLICPGGVDQAAIVARDLAIDKSRNAVHFVFVDGDHRLEAVREDLKTWAAAVGRGGIVSGHDFGHPRNARGFWGVDRAAKEYCEQIGSQLHAKGSVWWTVKS